MLNMLGPGWIEGRNVQDLCCGSGAVGLECLGCGASHVSFVDSSPRAIAFVRVTLQALGVGEAFDIRCCDVRRLDAGRLPLPDLVFLDPPYDDASLYSWIRSRQWPGVVSRGGFVFVEAGPGETFGDPWHSRKYGGSVLSWLENL
jgi:16S rRNA (guanine966-N2)-methyltransferase